MSHRLGRTAPPGGGLRFPEGEFLVVLEILAMLFLVVLALFALGSGLCAVLGLVQFAMGGGPFYALVGGALAAASLSASLALHRYLSRRPAGGRHDGPG